MPGHRGNPYRKRCSPRCMLFYLSCTICPTGPASTSASQQHGDSTSGTFTVSPAAPALTDSQRARASKALARSLQLQQQRKLSYSPQLELLVVQPLSTFQQFAQGVGAFAHTRIGTCQTGQLDQDLHEQDAQTEEVRYRMHWPLLCSNCKLTDRQTDRCICP
jgi:hypothetical protein